MWEPRRHRPGHGLPTGSRTVTQIPPSGRETMASSPSCAWVMLLTMSEHGASHGLCQIYGNEPWHYELRPKAVSSGCPPLAAVGAVLNHR